MADGGWAPGTIGLRTSPSMRTSSVTLDRAFCKRTRPDTAK